MTDDYAGGGFLEMLMTGWTMIMKAEDNIHDVVNKEVRATMNADNI